MILFLDQRALIIDCLSYAFLFFLSSPKKKIMFIFELNNCQNKPNITKKIERRIWDLKKGAVQSKRIFPQKFFPHLFSFWQNNFFSVFLAEMNDDLKNIFKILFQTLIIFFNFRKIEYSTKRNLFNKLKRMFSIGIEKKKEEKILKGF